MTAMLGVDVSKDKLDVALMDSKGKYRSKVFPNKAEGFAALVQWLDTHAPEGRHQAHICMEATGVIFRRIPATLIPA